MSVLGLDRRVNPKRTGVALVTISVPAVILFARTNPDPVVMAAGVGGFVLVEAVGEVSGLNSWYHGQSFEQRLLIAIGLTVAVGVCLGVFPSLASYPGIAVGMVAGAVVVHLGRLAATLSGDV